MKIYLIVLFLVLSGCSKKSEISISKRETFSQERVESVNQALTFNYSGVNVSDEMDSSLEFVYESKISAPMSNKNTYTDRIQATSVSVLSSSIIAIAYNTKTEVVEGGLDIVDVSDLQHPVILFSYVVSNFEFSDSKFLGGKLYLTGSKEDEGSVLVTLNVNDISNPIIDDVKILSSFYGTSLSIDGTNLLVSSGNNGDVKSFNLSSGIPTLQHNESFSNLLYVKHYKNGYLFLFDYNGSTHFAYNDLNLNSITKIKISENSLEAPARFDLNGNVAYISNADEEIISQVNLNSMQLLPSILNEGRANGLFYEQGLLYSASGEEGFKLYDVRDIYSPVYKGYFNFDDRQSANNIWALDVGSKKVVILADGLGGVKLLSHPIAKMQKYKCTNASSLVSYLPKPNVPSSRRNTAFVLGTPNLDQQNVINFTTLGKGGSIIVEFDVPIKNVVGNDLRVYEVSWGATFATNPEQAEVYGSNDGVSWTYLGVVKNDNGNPSLGMVELGNMIQSKYIKLVDITTSSASDDGFDVAGFSCLNQ